MGSIWFDLRYALRGLVKTPGFSALILVMLALGIGANTAMFSLVHNVLLLPLAFKDPDRLALLFEGIPQANLPRLPFSPPDLMDFRDYQESFSEVAAFKNYEYELSGTGDPERILAAQVSSNLFRTVGVTPALGRGIRPEEEQPGHDVAVLSYAFWQSRFGGSPQVLDQTLLLNRRPFTIVGVMPASFSFPLKGMTGFNDEPAAMYLPLAFTAIELQARASRFQNLVLGRLKDGVTLEAARSELPVLAERVQSNYPEALRSGPYTLEMDLVPLRTGVVGDLERPLLLLLGAVGLVLLVVCANVANLTLSRAAGRQSEMAVRQAMGASRSRLLRLLVSESLILALGGGLLGLALALGTTRVVLALLPGALPLADPLGLNLPILAFTLGVTLLTTILFGFGPLALTDSVKLETVLRQAAGKSTGGRRRQVLQRSLVVTTVATAAVLLVGAGLLIRSFNRLVAADTGFQKEQVLTLALTLPNLAYGQPNQVRNFARSLHRQVAALPGVKSASLSTALPMSFTERRAFSPELTETPDAPPSVTATWVHGSYFQTLGIPILSGRPFKDGDNEDSRLVTIVSQQLAQRYWPGQEAVGKRIKWGLASSPMPWFTIVGVAGEVNDGPVGTEPNPHVYVPYAQFFDQEWIQSAAVGSPHGRMLSIAVSAPGDPTQWINPVLAQVRSLDPSLPVNRIQTLDELLSSGLARQRFSMLLVSTFGGLALLLAGVGIYGVLSLGVAQRRREIGVRVALGADRGAVVRMVVRGGMGLVIVGLLAGLAAAAAVARLMASVLYEIRPGDPWSFAAVPAVLLLAAFLASYLPARRAGKVDPMTALREE